MLPAERPSFHEPWQAQAMAMADTLIKSGHVDAEEWSVVLGSILEIAEADGAPDTVDTYYACVLKALEHVTEPFVTAAERNTRRVAWEDAYRRTPHGKPVALK